MSEIKNAASTHGDGERLLRDDDLDRVNGGVNGHDGGCVPYINWIERHDPGIPYPSGVGIPFPSGNGI